MSAVGGAGEETEVASVQQDAATVRLAGLVEKLAERIEKLESTRQRGQYSSRNRRQQESPSRGVCWQCGKHGHFARNCTQSFPPGKLNTLSAKSRVFEGDLNKAHNNNNTITISPVTPTAGGYHLDCSVNGVDVPFLLDTGVSVTLLRKDVWERVSSGSRKLQPYSEVKLVGVSGLPLTVHGSTTVNVCANGHVMMSLSADVSARTICVLTIMFIIVLVVSEHITMLL